jgi:hypothetical protein
MAKKSGTKDPAQEARLQEVGLVPAAEQAPTTEAAPPASIVTPEEQAIAQPQAALLRRFTVELPLFPVTKATQEPVEARSAGEAFDLWKARHGVLNTIHRPEICDHGPAV